MNLSKFSQLAEIASGLAVIVTLVILVLEIRNNTNAIQTGTYDALIADMGSWRMQVVENEQLNSIFFGGVPPQDLSQEDRGRLGNTYVSLYQIYERAFIQNQAGNLDEIAWERFERNICHHRFDGFKEFSSGTYRNTFTSSFYEYWDNCYRE